MHANVVRAFKVVVPKSRDGKVTIELPDDMDLALPVTVVGYVQNKSTYAIVGAGAYDVGRLKGNAS